MMAAASRPFPTFHSYRLPHLPATQLTHGNNIPIITSKLTPLPQALPLLKRAYDIGLNTWDTANVYSNGASEIIIGRAIKKYNIPRHKLVILTKCFGAVGEDPKVRGIFYPQELKRSKDYVNQHGTYFLVLRCLWENLYRALGVFSCSANTSRSLSSSNLRRGQCFPRPFGFGVHRPPPDPPIRLHSAHRRDHARAARPRSLRKSPLHRRLQHVGNPICAHAVRR